MFCAFDTLPEDIGVRSNAGGGTERASAVVYFDGQAIRRFAVSDGVDRIVAPASQSMGAVAPSRDGTIIHTNDLVSHVRRQLITNYGGRRR